MPTLEKEKKDLADQDFEKTANTAMPIIFTLNKKQKKEVNCSTLNQSEIINHNLDITKNYSKFKMQNFKKYKICLGNKTIVKTRPKDGNFLFPLTSETLNDFHDNLSRSITQANVQKFLIPKVLQCTKKEFYKKINQLNKNFISNCNAMQNSTFIFNFDNQLPTSNLFFSGPSFDKKIFYNYISDITGEHFCNKFIIRETNQNIKSLYDKIREKEINDRNICETKTIYNNSNIILSHYIKDEKIADDLLVKKIYYYNTNNYVQIGPKYDGVFYVLDRKDIVKIGLDKADGNNTCITNFESIIYQFQNLYSAKELFENSIICKIPKEYFYNFMWTKEFTDLFDFNRKGLFQLIHNKICDIILNFQISTIIDIVTSQCYDTIIDIITSILYLINEQNEGIDNEPWKKSRKNAYKIVDYTFKNKFDTVELLSMLPKNFTSEKFDKIFKKIKTKEGMMLKINDLYQNHKHHSKNNIVIYIINKNSIKNQII